MKKAGTPFREVPVFWVGWVGWAIRVFQSMSKEVQSLRNERQSII